MAARTGFTHAYEQSLFEEKQTYQNCANVHDLPEIFHYWTNRHIRPKLLPHGFSSAPEMFLTFLERRSAAVQNPRFLSIGSGNCDLEIELARSLVAKGHHTFVIDCLDVNPVMLERGRVAARDAGVAEKLNFLEDDFNRWTPAHAYDAVMANQSLHHVLNLEGLFDRMKESLRPQGTFLISDMIGRNGHQRWPESLAIVQEFWRRLPPSYRINPELKRYEHLYRDWDCSNEGFEGVRSQDILPLLIDRFHFHIFIPFGNVIDIFVDRVFGHHFDAAAEWDRSFIDEVHSRDEAGFASAELTPTHLIAVLQNEPSGLAAPRSSVRAPDKICSVEPAAVDVLEQWPQRDWEIACRRIAEYHAELQAQFEERTAWALRLDQELTERTTRLHAAEAQLRAYLHNPLRYGARLLRGVWRRIFVRPT